ncbi:MAG TPA: phytanoyl-CoA dioxygenase family protein, partial [Steroidobacteraceae bacterium]|nr:phytanoyl-CoA dioxygenase family protein [Steroidobacteraceae bacterium]
MLSVSNDTHQPDMANRIADPYPSRVLPEPQLLPRRDAVIHSARDRASPLSQDQRRHYDENGYLVLENLFSDAEIETLQAELTRLRRCHDGLDPATLVLEPDDRELRSVFRIHEQSGVMQRLARDARLLDVARYLLADDVYVHQSRLNYKPGFFGKDFYWHSDFETWHVEDGMPRMRALSMSITLTENTEFNGPLMLVPGSHRTYVTCVGETPADHYKQSLRRQEYGVPDPVSLTTLVERGGLVAPKGPAGTVVIFDCNVMHGSNSNISPLPRSN